MLTYILKRLMLMVPTLLGISMIVFTVIRFAPGNPIEREARGPGGEVSIRGGKDENLLKLRMKMYGLDKPIPVQYAQWMSKVVRLDLGESITEHRPVLEMIGERIGLTIRLNMVSAFLIYAISIPVGLMAAKNRYAGPFRRAVFDTSSGVVLLVLYSLPPIVIGVLLITVFSRGGVLEDWILQNHPGWRWLIMPIGGVGSEQSDKLATWDYFQDSAKYLVLPIITMTIGGLAYMAKLSRTSLLENLRMDYVRTARAKGLRERTVVYVHAVRNSLLPMITVMAFILPGLIGGSVIIETIFNLPGMGLLFYTAVIRRDYTMIQAISLVSAALTLGAILIADILLAVADPRIRYD